MVSIPSRRRRVPLASNWKPTAENAHLIGKHINQTAAERWKKATQKLRDLKEVPSVVRASRREAIRRELEDFRSQSSSRAAVSLALKLHPISNQKDRAAIRKLYVDFSTRPKWDDATRSQFFGQLKALTSKHNIDYLVFHGDLVKIRKVIYHEE